MALFKKSESTQAFLKMGLFGFAGSGKTTTASETAIGLVKMLQARGLPHAKKPAFFLDTETGSDYVEKRFAKAGIELHKSKTRCFADLVPAVDEAEKNASVLIVDSVTHFWREFTESYAKKRNRQRGLEFSDWAYLKKEWGRFTDRYINSSAHIILCGRAGFDYEHFTDDAGKKQIEKAGVKMKAEGETGYEPSLLVYMEREMDMDDKTVARIGHVLKDRFDLIDSKSFRNPTFNDFKPHVEALNLGGTQLGVEVERTSEDMIPRQDQTFQFTRQQIEITLDEIQSLLTKHYPSTSQAEKKAKADLLEKHFGSRSWERIKTFSLEELRNSYNALLLELDGTMTPEGQVAAELQEAASETF